MRGDEVNRIIRAARRDDGAAAVEFALIAGVLVMLIFGMLQFGIAFFEIQNLRAATREGARLGAVGANTTQIRTRVSEASYNSIEANSGAMSVTTCPSPPGAEDTSTVEINTGNPALNARLQNIFTVDIPFMVPLVINTTVRGEFRCERGVAAP
jgi:Flp pilus assembly protein TadG